MRLNQLLGRALALPWLWCVLGTGCIQAPPENYITHTTWDQEASFQVSGPTLGAAALAVPPPEVPDYASVDLTWGHDFVGQERPVSAGLTPSGPRVAVRVPLGDKTELAFQGGWSVAHTSHALGSESPGKILPSTAVGLRHAVELDGARTLSVSVYGGATLLNSHVRLEGTLTDHWLFGEEDVHPTSSSASFAGVTLTGGGSVWMTDHRWSDRALDFGFLGGTVAGEPANSRRTGRCDYDAMGTTQGCIGVRHAQETQPFRFPHTTVGAPFIAVWRRSEHRALGVRVFGPTLTTSLEPLSWGRIDLTAQLSKD